MRKFSCLVVVITLLMSCDTKQPEPTPKNEVSIQINLKAGSDDLSYLDTVMLNGHMLKFSYVKLLLSQPNFIKENGEHVFFDDKYILCEANHENKFLIGDVGKNNFDSLYFGFGVDSSRNTRVGTLSQPAYLYPSDHALSSAHGMYWGWNPGYIWMKLEGRIDVNNDGDLIDSDEIFSLHTGQDTAYRVITKALNLNMNNASRTIQIDLDILALFAGYDLTVNRFAHPDNNAHPEVPLVIQIQNNANAAFGEFYE